MKIVAPNPKKKGVNLTLSEDEIVELQADAERRGIKPTSLATHLFRRSFRDLKRFASLEDFLRPHIHVPISARVSEESQQLAAIALASIFEYGDTEAITDTLTILDKHASLPWSRQLKHQASALIKSHKGEKR